MVTKRKWMPVEMVETILSENKTAEEKLDKLGREINNLPIRESKAPAPEGGISIRAAARKYGIPHRTISRWVEAGYIPVLQRARNWLYIDEVNLANLVSLYKSNPGQGKKTIKSSCLLP